MSKTQDKLARLDELEQVRVRLRRQRAQQQARSVRQSARAEGRRRAWAAAPVARGALWRTCTTCGTRYAQDAHDVNPGRRCPAHR